LKKKVITPDQLQILKDALKPNIPFRKKTIRKIIAAIEANRVGWWKLWG